MFYIWILEDETTKQFISAHANVGAAERAKTAYLGANKNRMCWYRQVLVGL